MMKKTLCFLLAIVFTALTLAAQPYPLQDGFKTYVFGTNTNVRAEPNLKAAIVAKLDAGTPITVLSATAEQTTFRKMTLPWYQVQMPNDSIGYIWGGLVSYGGEQTFGDVQFVLSFTAMQPRPAMPEEKATTLELRAVRQGVVLDKCSIRLNLAKQHSLFAYEIEAGARGLQGYSALLHNMAGYEACGYPWYDWYVLWDDKQLTPLPVCESVSDAGVFSHVESYVFPKGATEKEQGHYGTADEVYFQIEYHQEEEMSNGLNKDSWSRMRRMQRKGAQFLRPKDMGIPR